ncbi:MAG TPA: hypothetical protein VME42_11420 [Steroidobacteraceae bacterium]|nr:hypothetical protein [Steroidobacteraceae bacterium]
MIADEIGVSHVTVGKARATGKRLPVQKRLGKDGKLRRARESTARENAVGKRVGKDGKLRRARTDTRVTVVKRVGKDGKLRKLLYFNKIQINRTG